MTVLRDRWHGTPVNPVVPGSTTWAPAPGPQHTARAGEDYLDISQILRAVRRQAWLGIVFVLGGVALAVAYIATAQPLYTAYATILLDEERAELLDLVSSLPSAVMGDAAVQSEVEILKSHELALRVVERLDLVERREELAVEPTPLNRAVGAARGFVGSMLDSLSGAPEGGAAAVDEETLRAPERRVADLVRGNLEVDRVGRSYVLELSYTAPSPQLAAEIARVYTDAYLSFQLEENASAAGTAVDWLRERVGTLREAGLDANRELERFRREHNLVSVGARLLSEQQLSEVMSQLILAEADAARAGSVLAQTEAMVGSDADSAIAALSSADGQREDEAVETLKSAYLTAQRRRRAVVEEFGEDHPEAQRLAREIAQTEALIVEELERRVVVTRNAFDAANSRVEALRSGLTDALATSATDEETLSRLRQLEQTNTTYQQMYQDALTRLEKAVQAQSVPIVAARVITEPNVPRDQSSPSKSRILAIGIFLGLVFGGGIGALREFRRDALDTKLDVQRTLGLPLMGVLSRQSPRAAVDRRRRGLFGGKSATHRLDSADANLMSTLRAIKLAADDSVRTDGARTIAFISARPGEGKTTLAVNFVAMLAKHGFATLLVDANPHNMTATQAFAPDADVNLAATLQAHEEPPLMELPAVHPDGWYLLPLSPLIDPYLGILQAGTERMNTAFECYKKAFDYIVIDGAAASEGREADVFSAYADVAVLVGRRGHAKASEVAELADAAEWRHKTTGVIVNKA